METQALNSKLARWIGLHYNEPTGGFWWDKSGRQIFDFHNPDEKGFTGSLDTCFKRLFRPVCDYFVSKTDSYADYQRAVSNFLTAWIHECIFNEALHNIPEPELEATAFCLAVEKLIDWRKQANGND